MLALGQATRSLGKDGERFSPFAMIDTGVDRELMRFQGGDAEAGLGAARDYVRAAPSWKFAAVVWEGPVDERGSTARAVFVEAGERGFDRSVVLSQAYGRRGRLFPRVGAVGGVSFVGFGAPLP